MIGAKYTFTDAAHTGTIKYLPYNSTATLAGGTINLSGPSIINVNTAAAVNFYTYGHYLEIDGVINTIGNIVHAGSESATPATVVLKGQYFADFHAQIGGQQGGDAHLIIDGASVYNCRPDARVSSTTTLATLGNFRVTVKSGELKFSNTYKTEGTDFVKGTNAFLTLVFNNNSFFNITPHVFSSQTRTNFLNYVTSNATFNGGEAIWRSAEPDCYVSSTSTHGVYDVTGDKVAYYQTSDKKTVYYSYNGKITLPDINNGNILWMDELDTDLLATPGANDAGVAFVEWDDDGKGTLTASYKKTPKYYSFYVKSGGTGDGTSVENAAGNIYDVITSINADGHDENSEVTVYLIDSGEIRDVGAAIKRTDMTNYMNYGYGANHTAKITFTTYNYKADEDNRAVLYMHNDFVPYGNNPTTLISRGTEKFENLIIVDCRTDYDTDVYAQGHDVEYKNITFRRLKSTIMATEDLNGDEEITNADHAIAVNNDGNATIISKAPPFYTGANRGGTGTIDEGGTVVIDNPKIFYDIRFGGYSDSANHNASMTHENSHTVVLNGNSNNVILSALKNDTFVQTYKKNVNLIVNSGTVPAFKINTKAVVEGAIQVILNNGAALTNFTAVDKAAKDADSDVGTARYFVMSSAKDSGTLEVTDTTGKFKINSTKPYAYAYSDDSDIAYYDADYLTIGNSGKYTVGYTDSIDNIANELPAIADKEEEGLLFDGWTDNGDGTLTASFRPKVAVTK